MEMTEKEKELANQRVNAIARGWSIPSEEDPQQAKEDATLSPLQFTEEEIGVIHSALAIIGRRLSRSDGDAELVGVAPSYSKVSKTLYNDMMRDDVLSTLNFLGFSVGISAKRSITFVSKRYLYEQFLVHSKRNADAITVQQFSRIMKAMGVGDKKHKNHWCWMLCRK